MTRLRDASLAYASLWDNGQEPDDDTEMLYRRALIEVANADVHRDDKFIVERLDGRRLHPDEPVFVFRAQDRILPKVLDHYASECADEGTRLEHLESIARQRERVVAWQTANRTLVKLPD